VTHGTDRAAARVEGVRDAMNARGLALDATNLIEAAYTLQAGSEAATRLLSSSPRPTAIICGNDVLAAGALTAARRLGLSVPGDVSVTGFDNIDLAHAVDPELTTVHVPHRRMGQQAARLLLALCSGEVGTVSEPLETRLVEGGSLGAPS
jgi:LacI family transcriptional regulator